MDPYLLLPSLTDDAPDISLGADEFARLPGLSVLQDAEVVAVAVSGGPDSMALLALTHEWALAHGKHVHAMTVDHALRAESAREAAQVGIWITAHFPGVTHEILRRDADTITPTRLQEQAREDRYELMRAACARAGIVHLLLAHHRDDQAETFLFRLCKGSGLDGLAAMKHQSERDGLSLLRPLLGVDKARLAGTCVAYGVPYVKDPSNKNDKFARVRLRQLKDALSREGLSARRLAVTAERMARAREALEFYAAQAWDATHVADAECLTFDWRALCAYPADIRVRVLMRALEMAVPSAHGYGPRLDQVESLALEIFPESVDGDGFTRTTRHQCLIERSAARNVLVIRAEKP